MNPFTVTRLGPVRLSASLRTLCFMAILFSVLARASAPYSVPQADAPELASIGTMAVGVRSMTLNNPDQPDIPKLVKTFGVASKSDRMLPVEVWYPASTPAAGAENVRYQATLPRSGDDRAGGKKKEFTHVGVAIRDAPALPERRYPLVLVSHGFGGWSTFMTYLTENIASKGYVVVAIDHADAAFSDAGSFALSFGSAIVHRSRDQQFVLEQFVALAKKNDDTIGRIIDTSSIGIIGYSMGGFGALTTAGAGYDPSSPTFKQIPAAIMAPLIEGSTAFDAAAGQRVSNIKALVLMAPWGGQPANRAWTIASLQSIKSPTLFVVGDKDDIVDYDEGVRYLFGNMKATSRHMLVFQQARHNIGGNPPPAEALRDFMAREYFDEPVWRKDRITAINQHFLTAFLDLHLKGITNRRTFLDVPTVKSSDAKWPIPFGQNTGGTVANGTNETAQYWRGFQRRWALGLEMHRRGVGE